MTETAHDPTALPSGKALRALRARAHSLKPVVWIGEAGATPGAMREIDRALSAHELIKIHAAVDGRTARDDMLESICSQLGAHPVQVIGKMLVAFRERPAESPPMEAKPNARPARARAKPTRSRRPLKSAKRPTRRDTPARNRGR